MAIPDRELNRDAIWLASIWSSDDALPTNCEHDGSFDPVAKAPL
jgi:hypothetical protein